MSTDWQLPRMTVVKQHFPSCVLPDMTGEVRRELARKEIGSGLGPGARVAIGAGSRGVANLPQLVRATVEHFQSYSLKPFVIPAMGSHGGGTPEGQRDVLARLGVTEATVGCPVISSLETVRLGVTPDGMETYGDRQAFESDGIFLVNRVKWHTSFDAPLESGLVKMAAIGLGKVEGARTYHQHAIRGGLGAVIRSAGRHVLASGKVIGGLGVVEDAYHHIGKVAALRADEIESAEEELLKLARSWMARLLFDEVDILIVDEIGKQFSGTGMDSKIVNRHPYGGMHPWSWAPRVIKLYVRDLSTKSHGNAVGIGLADVISERLYQKIDWPTTLVNAQTASNLAPIRTPYRAANDRDAIRLLASTVGRPSPSCVTVAWIRNTLELDRIAISQNLFSDREDLEAVESAFEPAFDREGNLAAW